MADKTEYDAHRDHELSQQVALAQGRNAFVALPESYNLASLEAFQDRPNQIEARPVMVEIGSFADYVNRFADESTVIFADRDNRQMTAHLEYHRPGEPSHNRHHAVFSANWNDHYLEWRKVSSVKMSQTDAGRFLQERAVDVVEPEPVEIVEMVMNFEALKRVDFMQSTRLRDGQRQLIYKEESEVKGQITLPEKISISTPIFEGGKHVELDVRVEYRIVDARLQFTFTIHERRDVEKHAFAALDHVMRGQLKDKDIPIFYVG